jgi:hypothetical protein
LQIQSAHGAASPVTQQPAQSDLQDAPKTILVFLDGNMQPRRLTDSHPEPNNPRRGFELMNRTAKRPRLFRIGADASPCWRIVNPDAVLRSFAAGAIARGARDFCSAKRIAAAKTHPKRITTVDNAMTPA